MELSIRPRRLRGNPILRGMVRETRMSKRALVYPLFVRDGNGIVEEISAMPGQYRYTVDRLDGILNRLAQAGIQSILLFGIPDNKDEIGSSAWDSQGAVQRALRFIKANYPGMYLITDVCMCEYTSHGHCGILDGCTVQNDKTLELLARAALSHVEAGADMVAPSDMMDGRVEFMRDALDAGGFDSVPMMSYAVKYASAFYGPFREAAGSAPSVGDRRGYQMDFHNHREALKEASLDVQQGADIIMVKPALAYLDVVREVRDNFCLPVAAYSVSGEYAMVKAAAAAGYIDEAAVASEMATAVFRAGADILITYYAPELAGWMDEGRIG